MKEYDATKDAESILETTMCRKHWTATVRDELKSDLEIIVAKQLREFMRNRS